MESAEIKKYFPPFNLAQKISDTNYGVYCYEDGKGYCRFGIKKLKASDQPLASFPFLADARIFLTGKMKEFRLCPKLCGLQRSLTACFDHEAGTCDGACCGKVEVATYNRRVEDALMAFTTDAKSYAVIGKGRYDDESSVVMIENGKYLGFGFAQNQNIADNFSALKETIQHSKDNREVQRIIQGYLGRNHDYRLIPGKVYLTEH
jgi:DNA polymerase-3 subunit epsilon